MSRIFLSHSSANNAEVIALRDWLVAEGWSDLFLDLDPERGLKAGQRWQDALKAAAHRCEMVIFLISPAWTKSKWCLAEFLLAKNLNKRIFGVVVEPTAFETMPIEMTAEWQIVDLTAGQRDRLFPAVAQPGLPSIDVRFSVGGLTRLANGIRLAGIDAKYFAWPPETDPKRAPYRGLRPLEADDAGIFFGREAPVIEAIDRLRGLTEAAPPRLMAILGASGAGKSSFLRAGLLPRLDRDPQTFLPLPVIRPERAAISGENGLVSALAGAFEAAPLKVARGEIREAVAGGSATLKPLLSRLQEAAQPPAIDGAVAPMPPTLVLAIDQGEELFLAEAQSEAQPFLTLLRDLVVADAPPVIAVFTIRSDNYDRLQSAAELQDIHKVPLDLGPMPKGSYAEVVKGPIRRLDGTARAIKMDDALVDALLADIEAGGAKDALPLLAFTLERLYEEYGATGHLTLDHFNKLGRVKGSIEAAVERAFAAADKDSRIPRDRDARLTLLRRGLIPWLAGIDPDTKVPRRRVARLSEIPAEARPLIDLLVEQRLLSTDVAKDTGETTIEPAHEALLRQWGLLQGWLSDDTGLLTVLDGIKRAARDWASNAKASSWLAHSADRLRAAERLLARPDLAANLEPTDEAYVKASQRQEVAGHRRARRTQAAIYSLMAATIIALTGIIYKEPLGEFWFEHTTVRNFIATHVRPHVLTAEREQWLKPGATFRECDRCPEMIVIPAGSFRMGSPENEPGRRPNEGPIRNVTIGKPFAIGRFEVTWDQWDTCVAMRGCDGRPSADAGYGRQGYPVINVSWNQAKDFVNWLSRMTGKPYRLLSEAEWEYSARGVVQIDSLHQPYPWGDKASRDHANFGTDQCCRGGTGGADSWIYSAPVGKFPPNPFGIFDMHGNVQEWVEDVKYDSYEGAPVDGSARIDQGGRLRVVRGGAWISNPSGIRSADRGGNTPDYRVDFLGFRIARTLEATAKSD